MSDDLRAFINDLRARYLRGDYANHEPIQLHRWLTLSAPDVSIRHLLAQVDKFAAMTPEERQAHAVQRRHLASELRHLRDRLNGIPVSAEEWAQRRPG